MITKYFFLIIWLSKNSSKLDEFAEEIWSILFHVKPLHDGHLVKNNEERP